MSHLLPPSEEPQCLEEVTVEVDETLQDEFFRNVASQLQSVDQFFKKEELRLQFSLSELEDQVSFYTIHRLWYIYSGFG